MNEQAGRSRSSVYGHVMGLSGLSFSLFSWGGWWYPRPDHMGSGYWLLLFMLMVSLPGCIFFALTPWFRATGWWYRVVYAVGPLSYIVAVCWWLARCSLA